MLKMTCATAFKTDAVTLFSAKKFQRFRDIFDELTV